MRAGREGVGNGPLGLGLAGWAAHGLGWIGRQAGLGRGRRAGPGEGSGPAGERGGLRVGVGFGLLGFFSIFFSFLFSNSSSSQTKPNEFKFEFEFTLALKQLKQCSSMMQQTF